VHSTAQTTGIGSLTSGSGVGLSTAPANVSMGWDVFSAPIGFGGVALGGTSGDPKGGVCARTRVGTNASIAMAKSSARVLVMSLPQGYQD
jgi:hypothetical protein